jgi:flagellar hook assembly protein FlgD
MADQPKYIKFKALRELTYSDAVGQTVLIEKNEVFKISEELEYIVPSQIGLSNVQKIEESAKVVEDDLTAEKPSTAKSGAK